MGVYAKRFTVSRARANQPFRDQPSNPSTTTGFGRWFWLTPDR